MATPDNAGSAGGGTESTGAGAAAAGGTAGSGAPGDRTRAGTPRQRFRRWRRSRPFWGGLLVLLAGVEILLIPLTNVVMLAAAGLMMSMGIGGISGFLIGIVLTTCGVLLWFDPAHRAFYAIVGLAGGVISFPATNFGGFFLGLLLAITGGALAFAWTPGRPGRHAEPDEGIGLILSAPPTAGEAAADAGGRAAEPAAWSRRSRQARRRGSWRDRLPQRLGGGPALLALVLLAAAGGGPLLTAGRAAAAATPTPSPSQQGSLLTPGRAAAATPAPSPSQHCVLIILCQGPSPSPGLLPSPLPSIPGVPGGLLPGAAPGAAKKARKSPAAAGTPGIEAYTAPVVLSAGGARVTHFAYQGVAELPLPGGGTMRMMKFTAASFTAFSGINGTMAQGGHATTLTAGSLSFTGGITLYAAKFSGRLLGVPVTMTPGNAESVLLQLLKSATPAMPITMTDVVANQPIIVANSFQGQFTMSAA